VGIQGAILRGKLKINNMEGPCPIISNGREESRGGKVLMSPGELCCFRLIPSKAGSKDRGGWEGRKPGSRKEGGRSGGAK